MSWVTKQEGQGCKRVFIGNWSCYRFKIDCYNFNKFYIIAMVTTKEISIKYTQREMRRESKYVITKKKKKNQQNTKENTKREKEEPKATRQTENINKMSTVSPSYQ